jgi:hypothetical protein
MLRTCIETKQKWHVFHLWSWQPTLYDPLLVASALTYKLAGHKTKHEVLHTNLINSFDSHSQSLIYVY